MDEDEIIIPEGAEFHRVYDYLPYSHWRIKRLLKELGWHLEPIVGYKCNRVPGYKQKYDVVETESGKVIRKNVTLDFFREIFAKNGIPLHDE